MLLCMERTRFWLRFAGIPVGAFRWLAPLCLLLLHWSLAARQRLNRHRHSVRCDCCLFPLAAFMAKSRIGYQPVLGSALNAGNRSRVVWPDDLATRLEVHRSIHNPTSLRAFCDEQVSPSRAFLFLPSGARLARLALDSSAGGGVYLSASMELARRRAARSGARVRARLDCRAGGFLFIF